MHIFVCTFTKSSMQCWVENMLEDSVSIDMTPAWQLVCEHIPLQLSWPNLDLGGQSSRNSSCSTDPFPRLPFVPLVTLATFLSISSNSARVLSGLTKREPSTPDPMHTVSMGSNSRGQEATWHRGASSGLPCKRWLIPVLPVWPWMRYE